MSTAASRELASSRSEPYGPGKARAFGLVLLAAVGLAGLLVTACGGDDDDGATPAGGSPAGAVGKAVTVGNLTISGAFVRSPRTAAAAAYFTVANRGAADRLVSVSTSAVSRVELHTTVTMGGTSQMQKVEGGLEVPANGTLELKPGGNHIMLMGLTETLKPGTVIQLHLQFEKAGDVHVDAPVQDISGQQGLSQGTN